MGNFEKLVVLAVLFVAAVVLAISFNRGGAEVEASNPLSAAQEALPPDQGLDHGTSTGSSAGLKSSLPVNEAENAARGTSLLLNAGAESMPAGTPDSTAGTFEESAPVGLSIEPESDLTRRILRDTNGLRPSFAEDYMVYTTVAGDTWSGLAQRFYSDERFTRNLHQANDDLKDLAGGSSILVPVFDFLSGDAGIQSGTALVAGAATTTNEQQTQAKVVPAGPSSSADSTHKIASKPLEYVVQSGDTLSDISLTVFGTATRWKEIFEVNRDVLKKPEWLQVGMKLKLPAGGKLPATKAPAATSPVDSARVETKPKATTTSTTNVVAKKKKVL